MTFCECDNLRWTQDWDLHSHTVNSDGMYDEKTVAEMMKSAGVKYWSLTDHDTTAGWINAAKHCSRVGINFIPGIEITCKPDIAPQEDYKQKMGLQNAKTSWHLLAYFPIECLADGTIAEIENWLAPFKENRVERMKSMLERLNEFGHHISLEEVRSYATDTIGRPHLAKAMVAAGIVETSDEAFETWIGDGKPAHVENEQPTISDAVSMVKNYGGITSLAHPKNYAVPTEILLKSLKKSGVDAVEAFHSSHSDVYRHELLTAARLQGLSVTTGSDFHGTDHNSRSGKSLVPLSDLHPFFQAFMPIS